jgi:arginase
VLNALFTAPDTVKINTNQHIKHVLRDIHYTNLRALNNESLCITMGGDHTIAVGSVFASQDHCIAKKERLGVLWCDAHADFNTFEESCTKNLHGMPVAILCGHTLPELQIGNHLLDTSQIAYFGIRDIDVAEQRRMERYKMTHLTSVDEIMSWASNFDKIHVSFDADCIDEREMRSVNTPCPDGIASSTLFDLFSRLRMSTKIMSVDLVEYNPELDTQRSDANLIVLLLRLLTDNQSIL